MTLFLTSPQTLNAATLVREEAIVKYAGEDVYYFNTEKKEATELSASFQNDRSPSIYENKVVYVSYKDGDSEIYLKNLSNGNEVRITDYSSQKEKPVIYNNYIAWVDYRNGDADIFFVNLEDPETLHNNVNITPNTENSNQLEPVIYNNYIAWADERNGSNSDIFFIDISDSDSLENPINITNEPNSHQKQPAIYNNYIAWTDYRNGYSDIYLNTLDNQENFENPINVTPFSNGSFEQSPSIFGNFLLWQSDSGGNGQDIYLARIDDLENFENITPNSGGANEEFPHINNNKAVWQREFNGHTEIVYYDIISKNSEVLPLDLKNQFAPKIYNENIVWQSEKPVPYNAKTDGQWTVFKDGNSCGIYAVKNAPETIKKISLDCNDFFVSEGKVLLYEYDSETTKMQYYLYDLNNDNKTKITNDEVERIDVSYSNGKMVWAQQTQDNNQEIYYANINQSEALNSIMVSSLGGHPNHTYIASNPQIAGNFIAWNQSFFDGIRWSYGIYGAKIRIDGTPELKFPYEDGLRQDINFSPPSVSENGKIVWIDNSSGNNEIYLGRIDISNREKIKITDSSGSYQIEGSPKISDNKIVWVDNRSDFFNVYIANVLFTDSINIFSLSAQSAEQSLPYIINSKIVWVDYRNDFAELYFGELDSSPPIFTNLPGTNRVINIEEDQIIRSSPLLIRVRPIDTDNEIEKVEFYFANNLLGVANSPDNEGVYESVVDINGYNFSPGSEVVKVFTFDTVGNRADLSVSIVPDPLFFPYLNVKKLSNEIQEARDLKSSGDKIVWHDSRNGNQDIFVADLSNKNSIVERAVTEKEGEQLIISFENNFLLWLDLDLGTENSKIYVSDLSDIRAIDTISIATMPGEKHINKFIGQRVIWGLGTWPSTEYFLTDFSKRDDIKTVQLTQATGFVYDVWGNKILVSDNNGLRVIDVTDMNNISYYHIADDFSHFDNRIINGNVFWKSEGNFYLSDISNPQDIKVYLLDTGLHYDSIIYDFFDNNVVWSPGSNTQGIKGDIFITNFIDPSDPHTEIISSPNIFQSYGGKIGNEIFWLESDGNLDSVAYRASISASGLFQKTQIIETNVNSSMRILESGVLISKNDDIFFYNQATNELDLIFTSNYSVNLSSVDINDNYIVGHGHSPVTEKCLPLFYDRKSKSIKIAVTGDYDVDRIYNKPYIVNEGMVFVDPLDDKIYWSSFERVDIFAPEFFILNPLEGTTGDPTTFIATAWDNDIPQKAEISIDGGAFIRMTQVNSYKGDIGSSASFSRKINMPSNKIFVNYSLNFYDAFNNVGSKNGKIKLLDNDPPTVTDIKPLIGTTGDLLPIIINATDNIAIKKYQISIENSSFVDILSKNHVINIPLNSINPIKIKARVFDAANNFTDSVNYSIKVLDNDPPEIISVTDSAQIVPESPTITLEARDNISLKKAIISFDGVVWESMIGKNSPFSYNFNFNLKKESDFFVRVYDSSNNYTERDKNGLIKYFVAESNIPKEETVAENDSTQKDLNILKISIENIKLFIKNLLTGADYTINAFKESVTNIKSFTNQAIKKTPPPVAHSFPYLLFILLGIFAWRLGAQIKTEASQAAKIIEIIKTQKVIAEDKENFIILSSHYLRTPLTILKGSFDLTVLTGSAKEKLIKAVSLLEDDIRSILGDIEGNKYLSHIIKPDLKKEKTKVYANLLIWLPAIFTGALAFLANYIFINHKVIEPTVINLIIQFIVFILFAQFFYLTIRKVYISRKNIKEIKETMRYEKEIDKARNQFIDKTTKTLGYHLNNISKIALVTDDPARPHVVEAKNRFDEILSKLLLLREVRSGSKVVQKSTFTISTIIDDIFGSLKSEIKQKNIVFKKSGLLGTIHQNKKMISFILSSVISNAIKFSPNGGRVTLKFEAIKGLASVTVIDQGAGISKEGILHLFKPFTRVGSAMHFDYEGFGFSLFLSKVIAKHLGGDILVKSEKGKGTTVKILFEM